MGGRDSLRGLFALGTRGETDASLGRRLVLCNQVALAVVVVGLVGAVSNVEAREWPVVIGSGLLVPVSVAVLVLNGLGLTTASRVVLVLVPPLVVWLPPLLAGSIGVGNIIALPYAILVMSLLPHLLLRSEAERGLRWLGVLVTGGVLVAIDWSLVGFLEEGARAVMEPRYPGLKTPQLLLWALLGATASFLERGEDP